MIYSSKDIYNHALKLQKKMADSGVLEKYLTQVEVEGGTVKDVKHYFVYLNCMKSSYLVKEFQFYKK